MTDPNPSGATPPNGDPSNPTPPAGEVDWQKEAEKWKALSRKNEESAKANAGAAAELQTIKDSQLNAEQKAQKAAEKAVAEATAAKTELARYRVAASKGVPAELLTGADETTLNAQADALLAFMGRQTPTPPVPDLGQGNRGGTPPQDPNAWLRRMAGR
jgi:nucleotide-binding universal stress UspA family protein